MVRRTVDDQQSLRTCRNRIARGPGLPDVLADEDAEPYAAVLDDRRLRAGLEISHLVEDGIVRQDELAMIREQLAVLEQNGRVVDQIAGILGQTEQHADPCCIARDPAECRLDTLAKPRMQQ